MSRFISFAAVLFICTAFAGAGAFTPYPGSKFDDKASKTASQMLIAFGEKGTKLKVAVYMTSDSFEKVVSYYRAKGKEFGPPSDVKKEYRKLPSGEPIMETFVILDGAADMLASSSWVKIQRPYVGAIGMMDGKQVAEDVRNVTAVIAVQSK
jgi:hypothetical protein